MSDISILDKELVERICAALRALGTYHVSNGLAGKLVVESRLNNFKIKTKEDVSGSKFGGLYGNGGSRAVRRFPEFEIHNSHKFLENVKEIVSRARVGTFQWDGKWINPVTIAAHGWGISTVNGTFLGLFCGCCLYKWVLDLSDDNKEYPEYDIYELYYGRLQRQHVKRCPWSDYRVDIDKYYTLSIGNICIDIQRIEKSLWLNSTLILPEYVSVSDATRQIASLFGVDKALLQLLEVLVAGYQLRPNQVIECSRCFYKSLLSCMRDEEFNGHAIWCRYKNKGELEGILLELFNSSVPLKGLTLVERIANLEKEVSRM